MPYSQAQRMSALDNANVVRLARAQIKRDISSHETNPIDLVREIPLNEHLDKVQAYEFLKWIPYVGDSRAKRILLGVCSPTLEFRNMSETTRGNLARKMETHLGRYSSEKGRVGVVATLAAVTA